MSWLSICVPTYNRKKLLEELVGSILSQKDLDVELVVVDDGSFDGTREYIEEIQKSSPFIIRYEWQSNSGKATALRKAVLNATSDFIIFMDSDDIFEEDAFEIIKAGLIKVRDLNEEGGRIAGVSFNASYKKGGLIGSSWPKDEMVANLISIRSDYKVSGDKKEVISRRIACECIYDVEDNERRVPTSLLWSLVSESYDFLFVNAVVAKKDYLVGGITSNISKIKVKNPVSMMKLNKILLNSCRYRSKLFRLKSAFNYFYYSFWAGKSVSAKCGYYFIYPFAYAFYLYKRFLLKKGG